MVNIYQIFGKVVFDHEVSWHINDPLPVLPGKESWKDSQHLTCFTKCTGCITLSVWETRLLMQRNHDTFRHFCLKLTSHLNFC